VFTHVPCGVVVGPDGAVLAGDAETTTAGSPARDEDGGERGLHEDTMHH
jgi:hypothetical protein